MSESVRAWTTFAFNSWSRQDAAVPDTAVDTELIFRLGLVPLVTHACRGCAHEAAWQFDRADAEAAYQSVATANLMRLVHGKRVCQALDARGIPAVLIKGGAFVVRFGQDAFGIRPMGDLDLLVPSRALQDADRALRDYGAEPAPGTRRTTHARSFVLTSSSVPIEIDLHGAVAPWPIAAGLAARIVNTHERVAGWRVPRLSDALCLTALHRARHGFLWPAVDLFELKAVSGQLNDDGWRDVMACAAENHFSGAVWTAYRQAVWLFGADGSDEARIESLARSLHPVRRRLLARIAPSDSVVVPNPFWRRPLPRMLIVGPCATASVPRTVVAAGVFLPARIAEVWGEAKGRGLGPVQRARSVLDSVWRGDATTYTLNTAPLLRAVPDQTKSPAARGR